MPKPLPVTTPFDDPTVTLPLVLLQVPPVAASVSVVVNPRHTFKFPFIGAHGFTFTTTETVQPIGDV